MVDNAQANWNVICIVYGTRDPTMKLNDKECTYLFHWTQSLNRHTKQFIASEFQGWHKALCYDYENVKSLEETNLLGGTPLGLLLMV
jgi:hypothetical protein